MTQLPSTPTPENIDSVMRRIQKLLAIAEDGRGDPNEAASAASMAEKIMRKYQIEHADVILRALKNEQDCLSTADCVATAKTNGTKVQQTPLWANWLAVGVAKFTEVGARGARTPKGEACIRFFGFKNDVQVAEWMYNYLVSTVNRLVNEFKETDSSYLVWGRKAANSYRLGVARGILHQLEKETVSKAEEMTSATGTALVLAKKQAITERWSDVFETKPSKTSVARGSAFASGMRDGATVDIHRRGVTGQKESPLLT